LSDAKEVKTMDINQKIQDYSYLDAQVKALDEQKKPLNAEIKLHMKDNHLKEHGNQKSQFIQELLKYT
jgi:ribosomal protein S15P/S13E